jgi:type III pantothenate kinase
MVINAGTCITYDLVNCENEYLGGAISPGTTIRFKALHTFTDKLPLIENSMPPTIVGKTTQECILSGVMNGALAEMDGMIDFFRSQYPDLKIILSGGDAKYFDNRLKNSTFAFPNIVLNGLNIILDHYLEK